MKYEVEISKENRRGCGYRSAGKNGVGIYLMGGGTFENCERLPFPMHVCPMCGEGIRQFRGYRCLDSKSLFAPHKKPICDPRVPGHAHAFCDICNPGDEKAFLMWIGTKFYPTPEKFALEASRMGVSKKVGAVPTGFEIGLHRIYLIHPMAITDNSTIIEGKPATFPGIFMSFMPSHVDLVIDNPDNIPDSAKKLVDKLKENARIVVVEKIPEGKNGQLEVKIA